MDIQYIKDNLNNLNIEYIENEIMADHTAFKIGGAADVYCEPKDIEELKILLSFCRKEDIPYFIIGNGSNLLVSDEGIEGIILMKAEMLFRLMFRVWN